MLKNFHNTFKKLPASNKSMVYLMWVNTITSVVTSIFIWIYIFKLNNAIEDLLIYNLIFFTACLIWFSWIGYLVSEVKKDIKNMYYISYIIFILSFVELFFLNWTILWANLFWVLFGLWFWAFWNAVHTQELKNIEDKNRDFYSSSISAGTNILGVMIPLIISVIFYISWFLNYDGYHILFWIIPLIYIFSFVFINNIDTYIPQKITWWDFRNFFDLKKYKYGHLYFLVWWLRVWFSTTVIAVVSILFLKNEVNIGLFQWILAFISTFVIVHFSVKRNWSNRFKYFFILSLLVFTNYLVFVYHFNTIFFIIFSLVILFLKPLFRVSEHIYDLLLMDSIKTVNSDFYPAMILREIVLWLWRVIAIMSLLLLAKYTDISSESVLQIGLLSIGFCFLLQSIVIYFWDKYENLTD